MICPECSSSRTAAIKQNSLAFQFRANRQCTDCGAVWSPACPRWAALLSIFFGGGLALPIAAGLVSAIGSGEMKPGKDGFVFGVMIWVGICVASISALFYGVRNLGGQGGKVDMIQLGQTSRGQRSKPIPTTYRPPVRYLVRGVDASSRKAVEFESRAVTEEAARKSAEAMGLDATTIATTPVQHITANDEALTGRAFIMNVPFSVFRTEVDDWINQHVRNVFQLKQDDHNRLIRNGQNPPPMPTENQMRQRFGVDVTITDVVPDPVIPPDIG